MTTVTEAVPAEAVRCSNWARSEGLDPVASIGSYSGYLLVETPLPWPRDVGEMAALSEVVEMAGRNGLRLQALVLSSSDATPEQRRVILHDRGDDTGWFERFRRSETTAGPSLAGAV